MKKAWLGILIAIYSLLIVSQAIGGGFFQIGTAPAGYPSSPTFVVTSTEQLLPRDNVVGNGSTDLIGFRNLYAATVRPSSSITAVGGSVDLLGFRAIYAATVNPSSSITAVGETVDLLGFRNGVFNGDLTLGGNIAGDNETTLSGLKDVVTRGPWVDVRAYGPIVFGSGVTAEQKSANRATIQAALDNVTAAGSDIFIPPGVIYLSGTVNVSKHRTHIRGAGVHVTDIYADNGVVFNFDAGGGVVLYQCSLSNLSFVGQGTGQKIAIRIVDASDMTIANVTTGTWTGNTSKALEYHGRELLKVRGVTLSADRPISIEDNPNSTIDIDHAHFMDCYLAAHDNTQANFHVSAGINLTNVTIDGAQPWVLGKHGFYWADNSSVATSNNLSINNVRWEQAADPTGYGIYISHNYTVQQVLMNNVYLGGGANGFYFRKMIGTLKDSAATMGAGKVSFDIDNTVSIAIANVFHSGSATRNVTAFERAYTRRFDAGDTIRLYEKTEGALPDYDVTRTNGVPSWKKVITLDNGASVAIPAVENVSGPAAGFPAIITVAAHNTGNSAVNAGLYVVRASGANPALVSGTATMGTQDDAGKINLKKIGAANWQVLNLSGATQRITINFN